MGRQAGAGEGDRRHGQACQPMSAAGSRWVELHGYLLELARKALVLPAQDRITAARTAPPHHYA
jgi:hypothetical protein